MDLHLFVPDLTHTPGSWGSLGVLVSVVCVGGVWFVRKIATLKFDSFVLKSCTGGGTNVTRCGGSDIHRIPTEF